MYSQQDILAFSSLMVGAKEFYGTTVVGEIKDGKAQSTSTCVHEPPTPITYSRHLAGTQSMGISPLKADNTIEFGAIDIDNYQGDLMAIVRAIWDYDMPICPCFSKSKKLHLYFFFDMQTSARDAVDIMRWYAKAFACDKKVEIFPKQLERSIQNKAYSWINLPYFDAGNDECHRKMVKKDGTLCSLDEFNERARLCKLDFKMHKQKIESYPCYDAPPCILTGVMLRDIGQGGRNNWLFSAAVYLRLKDENCDLEELLSDLNSKLPNPLPENELRSTVLASLQRKSYFYMCSAMDRCDKHECQKLEHGVGSAKSTGLEYGDLKQIMTDPPTYEWVVNGQKMHFYTEDELLRQNKFRALCLRHLHIVPRTVPEDTWSKIVTKACKNIQVVVPDSLGNDFGVGSRFFDLVCKFFSDQRKAANESQIRLGRIWIDEDRNEYVFTAASLIAFIQETNQFKGLGQMEMRTRVEELGGYKSGAVWRLPLGALPKQEDSAKVEIDFNLHEGESEDF